MALRPVLDLELLRTLVFIAEEASFTRAAERVGRTQSAVTLQVQKLEALVGQPLLVRSKGGPVDLTPQGRMLVESARQMLRLNDETIRALGSRDHPSVVRLGASVAYTPFYLSKTLGALRSQHPNLLVEVIEGYSCQLAPQIKDDAFDLIVCENDHEPRGWQSTVVWRGPLRWITSTTEAIHLRNPLPLCLAPSDCPWRPAWMDGCYWRSAPLRTLERACRPYKLVAAASTMEGLYAPVAAGEAITVSLGARLPPGLRVVRDDEGLPPLPDDTAIVLKGRNAVQPLTDAVAETIIATFSLD
jgi:DNA-binding transcriptional LysR family regulator